MATAVYIVNGMTCNGCAVAVKRAVGALPGIDDVTVDLDTKQVKVTYGAEQVQPGQIAARIEDAGYEAELMIG
jgi:copper ion binding protein